jgi:hypothetical protein
MFKQALREPDDGQVAVRRVTDDQGRERLMIVCGEQAIECSFYNASRIFGMVALFLEIPLSKAVGKAIKFGDNTKMGVQ